MACSFFRGLPGKSRLPAPPDRLSADVRSDGYLLSEMEGQILKKKVKTMDCLFCKIVRGELPSTKVYEDDRILAFRDIEPKAPVHVLVIPKEHLQGVCALTPENSGVVGHIFAKIPVICSELGLKSYRVVSNNGPDAGQTVPHLHFHILGGAVLGDMG